MVKLAQIIRLLTADREKMASVEAAASVAAAPLAAVPVAADAGNTLCNEKAGGNGCFLLLLFLFSSPDSQRMGSIFPVSKDSLQR